MARNNSCQHVVDITGDILFSYVTLRGKTVPFLRMFGFVKPTSGVAGVEGLRIVAYGTWAELIYAHVRKGTRMFVITHVQQREVDNKFFTEFVIEEAQFMRNVDWDSGNKKRDELIERGELRPGHFADDDDWVTEGHQE